MSFSKSQIITSMTTTGVIPMFYHGDPAVALNIMEAVYAGGARVIEFTNRGPNAFDVFKAMLKAAEKYPGLLIGIGTVLDKKTTERYIKAGADFIISPIVSEEMAATCMKNEKMWIPGAATPTEIHLAKELGAEIIKIFPASVLGPGFISAVLPVMPELKLMATGGVEPTQASLTTWFRTGIICAGMGSQLITKEILNKGDWALLRHKVSDSIEIIRQIRDSN
jgi:2-dehydro-3-deoxyphosphogluconate aldolase/(4S)-4-hydroxy-2-oxoglutarate aldolase